MDRSKLALLITLCHGPLLAPGYAQCSDVYLQPTQPLSGDQFGTAWNSRPLDIDGGVVAVGAPGDSTRGTTAGAVYVFEEASSGWSAGVRLIAASVGPWYQFGASVSLDGDRLAVGAPSTAWNTGEPGRVYLFERSPGGWTEVAQLMPGDSAVHDRFGLSLQLDGARLVVGAPLRSTAGRATAGAAYVFERIAGVWTEVARLEAETPESFDNFGTSVALEGDRVVVGCPSDRDQSNLRLGAVYVFEQAGGVWTRTARLAGEQPYAYLGQSVALSGQHVVGGAPFGTIGGPYPGAAYVWQSAGGVWTRTASLHPTPGNDRFGDSVAIDGDALAIGAPAGIYLPFGEGRVHLYQRQAAGWAPITERTGYGASSYGKCVALDGGRLLASDAAGGVAALSGRAHLFAFAGFEVEPFCFCTEAGCHNVDTNAGCVNATGAGCLLTACGTTSVSRDDLVLTATNTGAHSFGLFFMGRTATPLQFFGNGRRCVDDPVQLLRFPARPAGPAGIVREGPGLATYTASTFPAFAHVMVGQRWNFQLWYRDSGACLTGYNVSNALGVTFTP